MICRRGPESRSFGASCYQRCLWPPEGSGLHPVTRRKISRLRRRTRAGRDCLAVGQIPQIATRHGSNILPHVTLCLESGPISVEGDVDQHDGDEQSQCQSSHHPGSVRGARGHGGASLALALDPAGAPLPRPEALEAFSSVPLPHVEVKVRLWTCPAALHAFAPASAPRFPPLANRALFPLWGREDRMLTCLEWGVIGVGHAIQGFQQGADCGRIEEWRK